MAVACLQVLSNIHIAVNQLTQATPAHSKALLLALHNMFAASEHTLAQAHNAAKPAGEPPANSPAPGGAAEKVPHPAPRRGAGHTPTQQNWEPSSFATASVHPKGAHVGASPSPAAQHQPRQQAPKRGRSPSEPREIEGATAVVLAGVDPGKRSPVTRN